MARTVELGGGPLELEILALLSQEPMAALIGNMPCHRAVQTMKFTERDGTELRFQVEWNPMRTQVEPWFNIEFSEAWNNSVPMRLYQAEGPADKKTELYTPPYMAPPQGERGSSLCV